MTPRARSLSRYCVKRLLLVIPILFGVIAVNFFMVRLGESNPAVMVAGPEATAEQIQAIALEMRLDDPLTTQFWTYATNLLSGDMGESFVTGRDVREEIAARLPATLELLLPGMVAAILVGWGLGLYAGIKRNRLSDHIIRIATLGGVSMPTFFVAVLAVWLVAFELQLAPYPFGRTGITTSLPPRVTGFATIDSVIAGDWATLRTVLAHLALPVLVIVISTGMEIAKQVRACTIEFLDSDVIRYARASGYNKRRQALILVRLTAPTLLTFLAMTFGAKLGGSAMVELVFSWGGIGQFGLNAVTAGDFAVVQGFVATMALLTMLAYIIGDLLVALTDPRVSYETSGGGLWSKLRKNRQ